MSVVCCSLEIADVSNPTLVIVFVVLSDVYEGVRTYSRFLQRRFRMISAGIYVYSILNSMSTWPSFVDSSANLKKN